MTYKEQLALAISLASQGHVDQFDKGGQPYILHPLRLMMRLRTDDHQLMTIAVMHDLVEDTDITIEDLVEKGFSKRVTTALEYLTHNEEDSYDRYLTKLTVNKDALLVKLEDLRDNSDITRLKGVRDKDIVRMKKYHSAYLYLSDILQGH